MAYNHRNRLEKIAEIQEITIREKQRGSTQVWIYEHYIRRQFHISKATYDKYLSVNARRELNRLIKCTKDE